MGSIILPIIKSHSDNIFNHTKTVEYRKQLPNGIVNKIYIYESRGCGMVVGEFTVADCIKGSLDVVWNKTCSLGYINRNDFNKYFKNSSNACAFFIGDVIKYDKPKPLTDFGIKRAPQNFVWIER